MTSDWHIRKWTGRPFQASCREGVADGREVCGPAEERNAEGDEVQSGQGMGQTFVVAGEAVGSSQRGYGGTINGVSR